MSYSIATSVGSVSVNDLSCGTVSVAVQNALYAYWAGGAGLLINSCGSDPVVQGTQLNWSNGAVWTVGAITGTPSPTTTSNTVANSCAPEPFDYAYASSIWALAFTSVIGLYLLSKNLGLILALIKGR